MNALRISTENYISMEMKRMILVFPIPSRRDVLRSLEIVTNQILRR